ncbi:MAG: ester cyclase [Pseudomonadota bacterium]
MSDRVTQIKKAIAPLRAAMVDFALPEVEAELERLAGGAVFRSSHSIGTHKGAAAYVAAAYAPLLAAWPDLERRDYIVIGGADEHGLDWVGTAGFYAGTFARPWLDIPPTGHFTHMRFHEFYRFEGDKVVEMQALWDIPEVMMQAGAWPLSPSLGREGLVPGPLTQDGIVTGPYDMATSEASKVVILDMLAAMTRHPSQGGPEVMEMERFWHPSMSWYGPAGIGTARGIAGFRNWHQIPFLAAMPDRGYEKSSMIYHFFGDGAYTGVTGWPNMKQTLSHPGWLGIAPPNKTVTMCSLDFWRVQDGLIRENWVMIDLIDMYAQIGVGVLARMREFNKARVGFDSQTGRALA